MTLPRLALAGLLLRLLSDRATAAEPEPIPLWPNGAPGSEGKTGAETVRLTDQGDHIVSSVHHPSITPYLPDPASATGAAVIVIPGGGHRELWMDHEGYRVGRWLSNHGIAAFVLKYRLARQEGSTYTVEGNALADVQRAMRLVRSRAAEWHLSPDRIGVMGFSAGGELAALAGTRYDNGAPSAVDPVDREGSRPAFMGLIYPSIPAGLQLSKETPPVFLLCGENDSPAISEEVPALYAAIRHAGGAAELHVLTGVGHGFGIRDNNPPAVAAWPRIFYDWLVARGVVGPRISLTPNAPFGADGAHLSFWKPSYVVGNPNGGEAGLNFWGIHNEGHVNVGFTPTAASYLLDCRIQSTGPITWKISRGAGESPGEHGEAALHDGRLTLRVPVPVPGQLTSVELWPTPVTEQMTFLSCDLTGS